MLCPECQQPFPEDGICTECGIFFEKPVFEIHDFHNYNVQHKRDYKKLDHFKEVLSQFQGKEGRDIPMFVIDHVRDNLPETLEGLSDTEGILLTRSILHKSDSSKYNENAHMIWSMVSGRQPPYIPRLIEDKLIRYFKAVVRVYEAHKGSKRSSFMNHYYVLYKLLHLMKETELLPYIPLLRTKQRIREHDRIWKKVCEDLDWEFYPT